LTNYELVIGVLSIFLLIVKFPLHCMHLFYPPVATTIHGGGMILYMVSAAYQGGSDMSDPKHPQSGPPWYITKSCSVAAHKSNIGYCEQAKALFAISIVLMYANAPTVLFTPRELTSSAVSSTLWNSVSASTHASSPQRNAKRL